MGVCDQIQKYKLRKREEEGEKKGGGREKREGERKEGMEGERKGGKEGKRERGIKEGIE